MGKNGEPITPTGVCAGSGELAVVFATAGVPLLAAGPIDIPLPCGRLCLLAVEPHVAILQPHSANVGFHGNPVAHFELFLRSNESIAFPPPVHNLHPPPRGGRRDKTGQNIFIVMHYRAECGKLSVHNRQ